MQNRALFILLCLGCGTAAAWNNPVQTKPVPDSCINTDEQPCVQMWSNMSAAERAKLWPYLDDVSRTMHWRSMTASERKAMRAKLSPAEREALRKRFSLRSGEEYADKQRKFGKLCNEDRSLMRRQIMEFHVELVGGHKDDYSARAATARQPDRGNP